MNDALPINEGTVEAIMEHHFKAKPQSILPLGGGHTNRVFEVATADDEFIVRVSEFPAKMNYFIKEQWAVAKARERGVPAPEILEVGNDAVPTPYMISRKVVGMPGTAHPDRLKIIHEMGKYASVINTIPTSGFGHSFDWSGNQLSKKETWKDFLEKELEIGKRLEVFERAGIFTKKNFDKLRKALDDMKEWDKSPTLNHSDMRLKNLLVTEDGKVAVILDWENCISAVSPYWEISIALHDLSIDEKQSFLDGYGMREKDFAKISKYVKTINLINYAGYIETMAERKDQKGIDRYKIRLNGDLDLYSL